MLLYALLHLTGYNIDLDELKNFRQWQSKTPGHPEYNPDIGVEVTTGPLGQGISNAVGMAIAQKYLASYFNRENFRIIDYKIYCIAGDGCLEEGISSEASSLAGHLGLNNLIVIYDDNHITIDGSTELAFTEDTAKRYEAYDWFVQEVTNNDNDTASFENALENAKKQKEKPSIIKLRTHIGYGSPNLQDSNKAHGSPLGQEEIKLMKENFSWDPEKTFHIPAEVKSYMLKVKQKGQASEENWNKLFAQYSVKFPDLAKQFKNAQSGKLPVNLDDALPKFEPGETIATRKASGEVLNAIMPHLPLVLGGSADLTPSNNTQFTGAASFQKNNRSGRYIRYGVREHAMAAIMNGISTTSILRPYAGTFLVFSDYMRPAIRMAAISKHPVIFVFTHDSIGLGEDGPTHSLRAIPNLLVIRPADANETAQAWKFAMEYKQGPIALILTRQPIPILNQNKYKPAINLEKGAYCLIENSNETPDVLLLATGSEVQLAIEAEQKLANEGIKANVISMPCWKLFEKQPTEYKASVLPPKVKARVGIEAGVELGWGKYLGDKGVFIGMSSFGASAPGELCFQKFGITVENVVQAAIRLCGLK